MRIFAPLAVLAALLTVPALSFADEGTPSPRSQAQKICRAERTAMGDAIFKATYGTNKNKSNAFGKCVSKHVHSVEAAQANAAKTCKAERALDPEAFKDKYGTGKNKRNALGKCVSQHAKAQLQEQQQAEINAAKKCKAERALDPAAFKLKYGTNKNKSNAFGKCVSKLAKAQEGGS